ncbi:MAG: TM0106 family RecB-like putative nuclease [Rhodospirillaceae bacterium]
MRVKNETLFFSPSDLITFMESPFASYMDHALLLDPGLRSLIDQEDPILQTLQTKGYQHEDDFLKQLQKDGKQPVIIENRDIDIAKDLTLKAMKAGAEVIAQGYLERNNFGGYADFLIKVPIKSDLGDFSYEVWDTKLSKKLKPYFAVQLCCYAEMLETVQGILPTNISVVLGSQEIFPLRVSAYSAYYRSLKKAFLKYHDKWSPDEPADPAESRSYGRWSEYAEELLRDRRHLCMVANITGSQIKRIQSAGITTIDELAQTTDLHIPNISSEILDRLRSQAALQVASEKNDTPLTLVRPHDGARKMGLSLLPPSSKDDIFFDLEGFPLIDGGLEYLWGATYFDQSATRQFRDFWAHNQQEEKQALEDFIDWVFALWLKNPDMHIYHYGAYEVTALRRLMGRYGTREHEIDTLLRNKVFVDLYNIVRNGLLVGEPSYSIKNIEQIYRGKRETSVGSGGDSVVVYAEWRTNPDGQNWKDSEALNSIREYNKDDCDSTQELTDWLRGEQTKQGLSYSDPLSHDGFSPIEEETETTLLRDKLLDMAEAEPVVLKQSVLRNLAWALEFHRRENKPTWWRHFERLGLTDADLYDDLDCLVGLKRTDTAPYLPTKRSRHKAFEYSFDSNQPFKGPSARFYVLGEDRQTVGLESFDSRAGLIRLKSDQELPPVMTLIPDEFVRPDPIPEAIFNVIENLLETNFGPCAIVDFLFRQAPRLRELKGGTILEEGVEGDELIASIKGSVKNLNDSYLCIQGPPGAGKTYTARHIIADLIKRGHRIGITSNSHKAIVNLMQGVAVELQSEKAEGKFLKIGGDKGDPIFDIQNVFYRSSVKDCKNELNLRGLCIGGTAWFFCNRLFTDEEVTEKLDYLFIDEAGQVPTANLIGMSRSSKNIILMGDQMQLGHPTQGSHPGEIGKSVLEYLLEDNATISPHLGIFLPKSYRMHPDLCKLISNQVYDGRLNSAARTSSHVIDVPKNTIPKTAGIHFLPVEHEGNTQGSPEEVATISRLIEDLIGCRFWNGNNITWEDILLVAPYNYQVNLLRSALPSEARIGTVDRFQGQEAPIVIISMCTSDASESPRGIDFLFSKNRLNVALSRAQSLAILVGSPKLANTQVNNLRQMELVNFYSEITEACS